MDIIGKKTKQHKHCFIEVKLLN